MLARALGLKESVRIDVTSKTLKSGDCYLLCSDGLHKPASEKQMTDVIATVVHLDQAVETLIANANENGVKDNVSAILACTTALVRATNDR